MDKKVIQAILVICAALLGLVLNQLFWANRDDKKMEFKNSPAGMAEIEIQKMELEIKLEKERRRLVQAENRGKPQALLKSTQAPSKPSTTCRSPSEEMMFVNPLTLSQGDCVVGETNFIWAVFKAPPKEISGVDKIAIGVELPSAQEGERRIRLGESCQDEFASCVSNWVGKTLFIERTPGQQLVIKS